jgi:hypothetical protein
MDETEMKKMFELSQENASGKGLEITPEVSYDFRSSPSISPFRRKQKNSKLPSTTLSSVS